MIEGITLKHFYVGVNRVKGISDISRPLGAAPLVDYDDYVDFAGGQVGWQLAAGFTIARRPKSAEKIEKHVVWASMMQAYISIISYISYIINSNDYNSSAWIFWW